MTLDGFLTFLTLAVAIYALVPPVTRLRTGLALSPQIALALIALTVVLYFQFYPALAQPCPRALGTWCRWLVLPPSGGNLEQSAAAVNPQQLSFLVVLAWGGIAYAVFKLSRLSPSALPRMQRVVDELMHERRFGEVLKLTQPHIRLIYRAAHRELRLQRWHDFFRRQRPGKFRSIVGLLPDLDSDRPEPTWRDRLATVAGTHTWWLYRIVPRGGGIEEAAENILHVLCASEDLIEFMATLRPYAAIPILTMGDDNSGELSDVYFRLLMKNPRSVLYHELKNNQNESLDTGYWSDHHNKILYFLFHDANVAHTLEVYRPIGEQAIVYLDQSRSVEYVNNLNKYGGRFSDDEEWKDPVFCAEFFFDIMVTSAARQGVRWHMWLYYFRNFIEGLIKIYDDTGPGIDPDDEFPNRTAFLLYQAFDTLAKWASLVKSLPADSVHMQFPGDRVTQDNGNIPASAVSCLSHCIGSFVMADNIGSAFKATVHEALMHDLRNLRRDGAQGLIRAALIQTLVSGGRREPADYGPAIVGLFGQADHVLQADLDDYSAALRAAYPGPMGPAL